MASMLLKDMVGPCGLEPQTSTVSNDLAKVFSRTGQPAERSICPSMKA